MNETERDTAAQLAFDLEYLIPRAKTNDDWDKIRSLRNDYLKITGRLWPLTIRAHPTGKQ
jgi:hypothetical protein